MSTPETLKAAPQFELPSGLPEGPWRITKLPFSYGLAVADVHGVIICDHLSDAIATAIPAIPARVEEIGRLRKAHDVLKSDCAECFAQNESLRALNAELIKVVQDMLYWADTPSQDISPSWITGACHRARTILAKCESQSASAQPRISGLPAQAPIPSQPAPGGIIETEKGP